MVGFLVILRKVCDKLLAMSNVTYRFATAFGRYSQLIGCQLHGVCSQVGPHSQPSQTSKYNTLMCLQEMLHDLIVIYTLSTA